MKPGSLEKPHPEKYFVESTKIWLAQQSFSFKYGSMEILFELTPIFLQFKQNYFVSTAKNMELQVNVTQLL